MSEPIRRRRSSRREFLTGKAVGKELRNVGDALADSLGEAAGTRAVPTGGETIRLETRAMGCRWAVVLNPGEPRQVMVASDALDIAHRIEDQLTVYRDDSDISRINRTACDEPQSLAPDLVVFLGVCRELWDRTGGAFDPASGALIRLWKQVRAQGRVPEPVEVESALACSGMRFVEVDHAAGTVRFLAQGLSLDFGAIGKGYAIDEMERHLIDEGVEHCLIHGGFSSVKARGEHAGHPGWPVGIRNPLFTEQRYATILLQDEALSTSGSNVQYFRYQGRRYGHILDPRSGWPADGLLSVTVVHDSAAVADALSTAFYVMGLDKALAYCDDHADVRALFVPPPAQGRELAPIVRGIPCDRLFFEQSEISGGS